MGDPAKPSVFGYVDQEEVVKRIDDVKDDDLASCFFGDSIADVESAATEIFAIGVRDEAESDASSSSHPFGVPVAAAPATPAPAPATPSATVPASAVAALSADERARQAFILGGPAALQGD